MTRTKPISIGRHGRLVQLLLLFATFTGLSCSQDRPAPDETTASKTVPRVQEVIVTPADDLQAAVDRAADSGAERVTLKRGTYRPRQPGQALLILTKRHDGLTIKADQPGTAVLTAENSDLAVPNTPSFPAVVNHVILAGDGVSSRTTLQGLAITGANGYVDQAANRLRSHYPEFQGNLKPGMFFFLDGGAVKVFGNSAPQFLNCTIANNRTQLCGAGVSIEQTFESSEPVTFKDCIFRDNHCPATGAAVDVLSGGLAEFDNCLFVGNIANTGMDEISRKTGLSYNQKHGCGALTVFPDSRVHVRNCTFTANWNGVDDHGSGSVYENSIFWMNDAWDESRPGEPYELDVLESAVVTGCFVHGNINDLRGHVSHERNSFEKFDPQFDEQFTPQNPDCQTAGYRPTASSGSHQER